MARGNSSTFYPTRDDGHIGHGDLHRDLTAETIEALEARYRGQQVYVSGQNFIYWEEGNPRKSVQPNVYVVFGVEMRMRDCYKAWEEGGRLPDVVIEFISPLTQGADARERQLLYQQSLRVPECFVFDPKGDYLRPNLQGFRLDGGEYVPLEVVDNAVRSKVLGLDLVAEDKWLRLRDVVTGELLPQLADLHASLLLSREALARASQAEAEVARLRAEHEALRRRLRNPS